MPLQFETAQAAPAESPRRAPKRADRSGPPPDEQAVAEAFSRAADIASRSGLKKWTGAKWTGAKHNGRLCVLMDKWEAKVAASSPEPPSERYINAMLGKISAEVQMIFDKDKQTARAKSTDDAKLTLKSKQPFAKDDSEAVTLVADAQTSQSVRATAAVKVTSTSISASARQGGGARNGARKQACGPGRRCPG